MIDVSNKPTTLRIASAGAVVSLTADALAALKHDRLPKGNPLPVARVAAVQAVKRTADIIPFCHPLPVEHVSVDFEILEHEDKPEIRISVTVKAIYRTGVEMEALTGASVAALTIVDMMKMVDEAMCIRELRVLRKRGGKSDHRDRYERPLRAAVLVMSDSIAAGAKSDASGLLIRERLKSHDIDVVDYSIIPDDVDTIRASVLRYTDELHVDLVVTTGGTGFSPRDCTPEALRGLLHRDIPGIPEAIRSYGQARTPYAMLSRSIAGIRGESIILTLPGSRKGVTDALDAVFPGILHSFKMIWMDGSPVHEAHPERES
jgi:molybdenum cofactor biosynthesis protein MoaC